jgi:hypothetical protein
MTKIPVYQGRSSGSDRGWFNKCSQFVVPIAGDDRPWWGEVRTPHVQVVTCLQGGLIPNNLIIIVINICTGANRRTLVIYRLTQVVYPSGDCNGMVIDGGCGDND